MSPQSVEKVVISMRTAKGGPYESAILRHFV